MHQSRLLTGMAALFAGMTVVLAVLGVVYNLLILVPAVLLAGVTYVFWSHASGRMAARFYRRVEQQAASGTGGRRRESRGQRVGTGTQAGRGGFGAGPREEWTGPRSEQRAGRGRRQRQRRRRAPTANEGPSRGEALETLGLTPDADQDAIKRAYREKVKEVHPDTDGGDEERFKQVNRAYERLTDD